MTIYFYVKKDGEIINPDISKSRDIHFTWCVSRFVETLNDYSACASRASEGLASFCSDMCKNKETEIMLNANDRLKNFYEKYLRTYTASQVGKLIQDIAKDHGYECYLSNKPYSNSAVSPISPHP